MSYCRICGTAHPETTPCPSDEEKAARILADAVSADQAKQLSDALATIERLANERDQESLQRAANWGLFQGTQERLREVTAQRDAFLSSCTGAEGEPDPLEALAGLLRRYGREVAINDDFYRPAESLPARLREACEMTRSERDAAND